MQSSRRNGTDDDGAPDGNERSTRVAFLGNSILYFNDCPRLLQHMMGSDSMIQESCLRGGASLSSLWNKGNGMRNMFRCPNSRIVRNRKNKENSNSDDEEEEYEYDIGAPAVKELLSDERGWDFVVMNDYTQGQALPVRQHGKNPYRYWSRSTLLSSKHAIAFPYFCRRPPIASSPPRAQKIWEAPATLPDC